MAKKVFAVYLAKEDVPNSEAYATLELPASPWELWDALDKVRLLDGEKLYLEIDEYYRFDALVPHLAGLDINLNELNDLAERLAKLDEVQGIAYRGLLEMAVQEKVESNGGIITIQELRNLAVSAGGDCCHVVDAADDAQLGADLAAAQNGHQRPLGVSQRAADDLQLLFDQEAGHGGEIGGHTGSGGVGPVHGAKGVGYINLCQRGQSLGKIRVIFRLALFKAGVFQQQNLTGLQSGGLFLRVLAHYIVSKQDFLPQKLSQPRRHRGQRQLFQGLLPCFFGQLGRGFALFRLFLHPLVIVRLRLTQMGAGNDCRALLQQIPDGGQRGHDAFIAGDGAGLLILRHIEIAAQQDLLALDINVADGFLPIIHKQAPI